ncbi:MAG: hypothetical protein E2O47_07190 [Gemmatimonadetes bacterium]|nr:MAG: hypothetical protein E2O47_07190 [Gemmatimonadota bacterium]
MSCHTIFRDPEDPGFPGVSLWAVPISLYLTYCYNGRLAKGSLVAPNLSMAEAVTTSLILDYRSVYGLEIMIQIRPDKHEEFVQAVEELRPGAPVGDDPAEVSGLFHRTGAEDRFLWLERWATLGGLSDRLASDNFRALLGAIRVLGELKEARVVTSDESDQLALLRDQLQGGGPG